MGLIQIEEDYPWDALAPLVQRARSHPDGVVDLSIGTPVDPTPAVITEALQGAANAPGYPTSHGTPALREAVAAWFARVRGATVEPDAVLPTIGSKEIVALLPSLLSLGAGDVVVVPHAAYPTYAIGARLAGAQVLAADEVHQWREHPGVKLVWVNSPSNPTGQVRSAEDLAATVAAAREIGAVVASDECYADLPWDAPWADDGVPSLLSDAVAGGSHHGLLAAYSLSKQSNLAGYRAAFLAGDPALISKLLLMRRHMGMIVPAPVQAAMIAALGDTEHVAAQRERYRSRRQILREALLASGFDIDHSEAGLYLWVSRREADQDCWAILDRFADAGILAGPGSFYGTGAEVNRHVRIALTATDERIEAAASRIRGL